MKQISSQDAQKLIEDNTNNDNFEIIDVRTQAEYNRGHIEKAKLIPIDTIEENTNYFKKDKIYLLYCRSGARSSAVQQYLDNFGINSINLTYGIIEWKKEGFELVLD